MLAFLGHCHGHSAVTLWLSGPLPCWNQQTILPFFLSFESHQDPPLCLSHQCLKPAGLPWGQSWLFLRLRTLWVQCLQNSGDGPAGSLPALFFTCFCHSPSVFLKPFTSLMAVVFFSALLVLVSLEFSFVFCFHFNKNSLLCVTTWGHVDVQSPCCYRGPFWGLWVRL